MEEENLGDLRSELVALEAEEAKVSAERRHLHQQIDFGYASETTRAREREVSDRRRELHGRIDAIRRRLGLEAGPKLPPAESGLDQAAAGIAGLERIGDQTRRADAPEDDTSIL